jgi:hypothetical protein
MNSEPKNLHLDATMPTNDGSPPIAVTVSFFLCETDGSGYPCQIQIRKKGENSRLWAELRPSQARLLAKRLKAAERWWKQTDGGKQ